MKYIGGNGQNPKTKEAAQKLVATGRAYAFETGSYPGMIWRGTHCIVGPHDAPYTWKAVATIVDAKITKLT